jgi:hypothetical protein
MRNETFRQITLAGDDFDSTAAGTTADITVYTRDKSDKITYATGTDVPTDGTSGYAKGCIFIDTDVATGISGRYENVGTSTSCVFTALTATAAEINSVIDGNTATAAEIVQSSDISAQSTIVAGAGFAGSGTIYQTNHVQHGGILKTEILIDMTGTVATSGDTLIIGASGVAHIGQNLTLLAGTILGGQVTCLETPAGGTDDVDLYAATAGTGVAGSDVTDLTETALLTKGGSWTASATPVRMSALPADTNYLYLTTGDVSAGTYTAGRFLIEMWGV